MKKAAESASLFKQLASHLKKAPSQVTLHGVIAAARPYFAAVLHQQLNTPLLIVTASAGEAERFHEELEFFLAARAPALLFPSWEVLPFESLSPSPEISSTRIATLYSILRGGKPLVIAPLEAATQFLLPKSKVSRARLELAPGNTVRWRRLRRHLTEAGYRRTERVESVGDYSRRGGILDIFSPAMPAPVRLEFFGDEIESLRLFEPESQRNLSPLDRVAILPAREIILDAATLHGLGNHLRSRTGRVEQDPAGILERASLLPGLEHYQATLSRSRHTLLDYFTSPPVVLIQEFPDLEARAGTLSREIAHGAEGAAMKDAADPARSYLDFGRWNDRLQELPVCYFDTFGLSPSTPHHLRVETASGRSFVLADCHRGSPGSLLPSTVRTLSGLQKRERILVVCRTGESASRLRELCSEYGLGTRLVRTEEAPSHLGSVRPGAVGITVGPLREGFSYRDGNITVITEEDIFGVKYRPRHPRPVKGDGLLPEFSHLRTGDFLVHVDHGVGKFGGLARLAVGDEEADFITLLYQGEDKLYVPVHNLDRVQRYLAQEGRSPKLDRLGGQNWVATKKKAKRALLTMARDLLRLHAVRQTTPGFAFSPDTPWQSEFEMAFEYPETEGQLQATQDTKADMERPQPMDRLVCGDVGYGKTEVAMRAAFKAVMDSKQVALLAPTTILVQQHLATFQARFASYPVRVEMLSRFVTRSRQRQIVADLSSGTIDIIIGTHRLLGADVSFRDLGLVIIDEEQRFGVRHKEALKKFRETVDLLTLTATPIPRTLHLAVSGIRDLSLIGTPPENRLAIHTVVSPFSPDLVQEAVRRELRRGGQVFFIHNRVQSIGRMASSLEVLLPDVRIGIAHGQMEERMLEAVMSRFRCGDCDLLLCTAIVESGLDIPNANTMIINRADLVGLAELYQLRGRIGRSSHRAYAYLLIPDEGTLTAAAKRRIEVLRDFSHLGAGFQIAAYDLEIRGAGSVIGYQQSGHIAAIGFELYAQLLRETIRELHGEPAAEERPTRVSVALSDYLPEDYIPDIGLRLNYYKKIAASRSEAALEEIAAEWRERFGPLPDPARHLLWAAALRLDGEAIGAKRLEWKGDSFTFSLYPGSQVSPAAMTALLKTAPPGSGLRGTHTLVWKWGSAAPEDRFAEAVNLLRTLR